MAKWEHNLPAVLIPDGEICVTVKIPNHPDYVKLFLRAVRMLETNRLYQRDENLSAKIVTEQWRDRTITPLIQALATGNGCPEDVREFDCNEFPAYASFIEYVPDNPFQANAPIPNNYLTHAWWRWGNLDTILPDWIDNPLNGLIEELTQYKNNDALTFIASLPYNGLGELIDNDFPLPYIKIHVTGTGTIRMTFLSIPLGGRIIVEVDEIPNIIDILSSSIIDPNSMVIDTDRDITSFPAEQWPVIIVDREIETAGDHIVYCMLIPRVNDGADFFGFGGGLRAVELCGGLRPLGAPEPEPPPPLEGVTELKPIFKFTADCGLEVRLVDQNDEIVEDFKPVEGWLANAGACFGGGEMATKEDIKEALIEWTKDTALKIVTGVVDDFEVDEDGNVVVGGTDAGAEIPEDDPETDYDENAAARMGGGIAAAKAIELYFDKIDTFYGFTNNTPAIYEPQMINFISSYFPVDVDKLTAAIADYYLYRSAQNVLSFNPPASLAQELFCRGTNLDTFSRWLIDKSGMIGAQINIMLKLASATTSEFWNNYYAYGVKAPSSLYLDAPCIPIKDHAILMTSQNSDFYSPLSWKANHRMQIIISGYWLDSSDGSRQDAFYYKEAGQNPEWKGAAGLNLQQGGGVVFPSQNQVPFSLDHYYQFTLDTTGAGNLQIVNGRDGRMDAANTTSPSGGLTVTIKDLGEYAL